MDKIVRIFAKYLLELESLNIEIHIVVHAYGVVESKYWNVEEDIHMLHAHFIGRGGRCNVVEVEVEWVVGGDTTIFGTY